MRVAVEDERFLCKLDGFRSRAGTGDEAELVVLLGPESSVHGLDTQLREQRV
jgi:hypothetical protein